MAPIKIYGLCNRAGDLKYIGSSRQSLKTRKRSLEPERVHPKSVELMEFQRDALSHFKAEVASVLVRVLLEQQQQFSFFRIRFRGGLGFRGMVS